MVDSPDGAQAPQQTALDAERAKLRAAGYTESEVSQILIGRAVAPAQAASGGAGGVVGQQGMLSGALNNFGAALKTVQNALPNALLDLRNIFAADVTPATRVKAGGSLVIKALLVLVVGYAISQEWQQHIINATRISSAEAPRIEAASRNEIQGLTMQVNPFKKAPLTEGDLDEKELQLLREKSKCLKPAQKEGKAALDTKYNSAEDHKKCAAELDAFNAAHPELGYAGTRKK